jgi:FRG domain-containing protein
VNGELSIERKRLTSWREVVEAIDYLSGQSWVFRGLERTDWTLQTSLEREFGSAGGNFEQQLLWQFVRTAPRWLPSHLVPHDNDAAAWLGLIQHYGGPTRLLDVTRSPCIALFFAFEPAGISDRAVWAIDYAWCMAACGRIMADAEEFARAYERTMAAQAQLVYCLVHRQPYGDPLFKSFKPFTGVFPVDPWKPDARQSAQQAMFLCVANPALSFVENVAAHAQTKETVLYQFVLPASLRQEALEQLSMMNVTAATLFPDLSGVARSLRTLPVRRTKNASTRAPWEDTP